MTELLEHLKKERQVEEICKLHSLNLTLLNDLFKARAQGYNNTQIAQKLGIHRVTAQRYADALRKLTESEFDAIYEHLTKKRIKEVELNEQVN